MLSDKDKKLISLLQENARTPVAELARKLNVSRTAAQARLEKLENNNVIAGYGLKLGDVIKKSEVKALVMIKSPAPYRQTVEARLAGFTSLTALHSVSGTYDLAAVLTAHSVGELDQMIDKVGQLEGVVDTMSSIVLSTKIERA